MALPFILLGGLLLVGSTVAMVFWDQIMNWVETSVFPWFRTNFPEIAPFVEDAFCTLDDLVVKTKRVVKAAWEKVRKYLLKAVTEIRKRHDGVFIRVVESWLMQSPTEVKKVTTEEVVSREELPDDVRQAMMRAQQSEFTENVTEKRDQQLETMMD